MNINAESILQHAPMVPLGVGADGVIRVSGTRVTLDSVAEAFAEGATAEEIAQQYPSVPLADIYSVVGHILRHEVEVSEYLLSRKGQRESVQQQNELRFKPVGLRDRLLARRKRAA